MSQTSTLNTLTNILTSPAVAFRDIKTRPGFLFPLLALLAANMLLMLCFFSTLDFAWMIGQMVNVLVAGNGQLTLEAINPVSFNNLFLHLQPHDPLFGALSAWDPFTLWNQLLMVLGFSYWMGKPIAKSAAIVLAPTLIIYGIWIAIALA